MRNGFRALRRCFAVAVLSLVSLIAARATAAESHASLRSRAIAGQSADVRTAVAERLGSDPSEAEKAALLEILAVADAWSGAGSPWPTDSAMTELSDDSGAALDIIRAEVIQGAYAVAIVHLATLHGSSLVAAARALELRELASGALRAHRPPVVPEHDTDDEDDAEPATKRNWYGWQTLITDGASLLVTPVLPEAGLAGYALGGPIVHLAHSRPGIAAASLGVRFGGPLVGAGTGIFIASSTCRSCELTGTLYGIVGAGLGAVGAVAIDSAVFARDRVAAPAKKSASVSPSAGPRREGGFDIGVAGTW